MLDFGLKFIPASVLVCDILCDMVDVLLRSCLQMAGILSRLFQ